MIAVGNWTQLGTAFRTDKRNQVAVFQCNCGVKSVVYVDNVRLGKSHACKRCHQKPGRSRNGKAATEYNIWAGIKTRCSNENDQHWYLYGGRGIIVCDRWLNSFDNFLADMGPKPEGMSIDRIDNDGPYSPENCRWATCKEQGRNKRTNVTITANGRTQCVAAWAEQLAVPLSTIHNRLLRGWSDEDTINKPVHPKRKTFVADSEE